MSGSIGLGAFIGSSYVTARNLPARMYAIFTGLSSVLEGSVPLRLLGITIRNAGRVPVRRTATVQAE